MKSLKLSQHRSPFFGNAPLIAAFCFFALTTHGAEPVSLAWDPSPDVGVGSYRVHYGTGSGNYTSSTNAGLATTLTVQGLSEGVTYFFAVTALGTNQLESDFSNEISYTVPPPQNTAPTISAIGNRTINEDSSTGVIGFTVGDAESSSSSLNLTASSSNTGLVPNASVVFGGSAANRTLTITPAANQAGSSQITVNVSDGDLSASRQFTLTVVAVNDAPTLAAIAAVNVGQDSVQRTVNLSGIGTGAANESQTLTVTANSSNPSLIPNPIVSYSSPSSTGSLRFTPAPGQNGSAQVTVTVTDSGNTANGGANSIQRSFTVTVVESDNLPPTLASISNVTVAQAEGEPGLNLGAMGAGTMIWAVAPGGAPQTKIVSLTGIGTGGESSQTLTVTASSSNPSLVPDPTVTYTSPSSTGTLRLTPTLGATGSSIITVTVQDNGSGNDTVQKTFAVNVTGPANSPPSITTIASQIMEEDGVLGPVGFSVADAQTSAGNLVVTAVSGNTTLLSGAGLQMGGSGGSRNVRVSPVANQSGKALITLAVTDGGGAMVHKSFWVTVRPVNDAPTLNTVADVVLAGDDIETITLAGVGVGPLDGVQSMMVQASSSNPSILPHPEIVYSSPNATAEMQLAPVSGASGSATITVMVKDDGGKANGGEDTISRTFTVTAGPQLVAATAPQQTVQTGSAASLAVPQPSLQISTQNGQVVLVWDGASGPYVLERTVGLSPDATWTAVEDQPQPAGGSSLRVSLQPEHPIEFFRLSRQ